MGYTTLHPRLAFISIEPEWKNFFEEHCNALFQTALLLSADALAAEAALIESIQDLDLSSRPGSRTRAAWERAVVMRSIDRLEEGVMGRRHLAQALLQPDLWPVLKVEPFPRMCFVLRMLLGYANSACAHMLGVDESGVRTLLQAAASQLCHRPAHPLLLQKTTAWRPLDLM